MQKEGSNGNSINRRNVLAGVGAVATGVGLASLSRTASATPLTSDDSVLVFNNISALKNATGLNTGQVVKTKGYHNPGDKGAAEYLIVAENSGAADDGMYIDIPNGTEARQAKLQCDGFIPANVYGAGTGNTDDTTRFKAMVDAGINNILLLDNTTYHISELDLVDVHGLTIKGESVTNSIVKPAHNSGEMFILENTSLINFKSFSVNTYEYPSVDAIFRLGKHDISSSPVHKPGYSVTFSNIQLIGNINTSNTTGILLEHCWWIIITDTTLLKGLNRGIEQPQHSVTTTILVEGNSNINGCGDAVYIAPSATEVNSFADQIRLENCSIESATRNAVYVKGRGTHVSMENVYFEINGLNGTAPCIQIEGASAASLSDRARLTMRSCSLNQGDPKILGPTLYCRYVDTTISDNKKLLITHAVKNGLPYVFDFDASVKASFRDNATADQGSQDYIESIRTVLDATGCQFSIEDTDQLSNLKLRYGDLIIKNSELQLRNDSVLNIQDSRIHCTQSSVPNATAGIAAGWNDSGNASMLPNSTDVAGQVQVTMGTGYFTANPLVSVVFSTPYPAGTIPIVILTPATTRAAVQQRDSGVSVEATNTGFTIHLASGDSYQSAGTPEAWELSSYWNYHVIGI